MERWKRRRYIRSSTLLLLLMILLIWYWWTHAPGVSLIDPTRSGETAIAAAGAWIVEPLSDTAYLPALLSEIGAAERTIDVALYVIRADIDAPRVRSILDALVAAAERGVRVRVLLDKPPSAEASHYRFNQEAAELLEPSAIEVRFDHASIEMHDKMILFDDDRLIVGAHNWTESALGFNRELSLLVRPIDPLAAPWLAFEALWQGGLGGEPPAGDEDESSGDVL